MKSNRGFQIKRIAATLSVLIVLGVTSTANANENSSSALSQVHKGATALTWLTNPEHKKFGTVKSRVKAMNHFRRLLFAGMESAGFHQRRWFCVHQGEATWGYHGYYDGGMQMDDEFQATYGLVYLRRWGDAGYWPIWAQVHASFTAWLTRGWWPWPNTARNCGLI